ncbi:sensor histidine kinase [Castellaniella sp.]|uniref:sensor histidine kinase n=1 Tax=Castellaniella sp. TaxID=1955812 RepID=UPI002AFDD4F8|nr:ATP-binding protein [Castellaniella sp.]
MKPFPSYASLIHRRTWQWLVPILCALLFLTTVIWLPHQAQQMESSERQEQLIADTLWVEQTIRFQLGRNEDDIRSLANAIATAHLADKKLQNRMHFLLRNHPELVRIAWIDADGKGTASNQKGSFILDDLSEELRLKLARVRDTNAPEYIQPTPPDDAQHPALMDYLFPIHQGSQHIGWVIATYSLTGILEQMVPWWFAQKNQISLTDRHENALGQRTAGGAGRGVYTYAHDLHLPYADITLRTDSVKGAPNLLPNLLVVAVVALTLGLFWSLGALWRDINRRTAVERALREQIAFRTAMEDSLVTGLRVYDLNGRITYVNPAFCRMVGIPAQSLIGLSPPMPYWAPEVLGEYQERFAQRMAGTISSHGFETVFLRHGNERFPVLVYESALVDETGQQTGWMSSILDISDRKRFEELNRRQQEKLQASARMVTMGEIASTLAHELNQPLAAITSYTTGALNLLENPAMHQDAAGMKRIRGALEKANTQAQRAGHVIRSVHSFAKRREPHRETVALPTLIADVAQLAELQASQHFISIKTDIQSDTPAVLADPMMLEQVLLNLTRNAIEAMRDVEQARRVLHIGAGPDPSAPGSVTISVADRGCGIPPHAQERLFSPFFSTKSDGMGMGLKICRTVVEFHGGTLTYADHPEGGTIFRFSLPASIATENMKK